MYTELKPKVKTWIANVQNGKITSRTEAILYEIYKKTISHKIDLFAEYSGRVSTDELRESLNIPHQTLTAILSNLQDEGIIYVSGEKERGSEFYSYWSYTLTNDRAARLIRERQKEKFYTWIRRGLNDFEDQLPEFVKDNLRNSLPR